MFTGIVTSLGTLIEKGKNFIVVDTPGINEPLGASIAVDGCCLTVVSSSTTSDENTRRVRFDLLPETIKHTRIDELSIGDVVNLEPALRAGDALGGHLVQGHVDSVGRVRFCSVDKQKRWKDLWINIDESLRNLCIERGSITINGVSLTIMEVDNQGVRIQLIPETQQRTNLGNIEKDAPVNIEIDVIARYVERYVAHLTGIKR